MKRKTVHKKKIDAISHLEGLDQEFPNSKGVLVSIRSVLRPGDWWELKKGNIKATIITHNGVKQIADVAGISTDIDYSILTQPDVRNNYQNTWQVKIHDVNEKYTTEIGESNRGNLGSRGRNNPANMAQKRGYDRAVFRHLGITGLLGEDELPDDIETTNQVNKLTHEDQKVIAPLINDILQSKTKKDLISFRTKMKNQSGLSEGQLDVLRNLWKKTLANLEKSF